MNKIEINDLILETPILAPRFQTMTNSSWKFLSE